MTREIRCIKCAQRFYALLTKGQAIKPEVLDLEHSEHAKFVFGTTQRPFCCDSCGKAIHQGTQAWATSIWRSNPRDLSFPPGYSPWENEFIDEITHLRVWENEPEYEAHPEIEPGFDEIAQEWFKIIPAS